MSYEKQEEKILSICRQYASLFASMVPIIVPILVLNVVDKEAHSWPVILQDCSQEPILVK